MNSKFIFFFILLTLFVSACSPTYEALGQCLGEKGVKMYGAFWCPHCQQQKEMFGDGFDKITYIECSTPNGNAQTKVCADAGIKSYPTWEFPDGRKINGELSAQELADLSNCTLLG